ncbi:MAG: ABC transporter permease [Chloroflexota bacterium]|nr:MAG: ABC transporter permease [Chloroflexota bacterium]
MILFDAFQYAAARSDEWLRALEQHLVLVAVALAIGIALCVPLGILSSRSKSVSFAVINSANGLRVIPSLAILFLAIPYFGLSFTAAALALTLLALPPILINTDAAFRTIPAAVKEAAYGMGMTSRQVLWRIELPLALPVIVTGIRTATIEVIASATLAAFIGGGGLGIYITRGFALFDNSILLVGAISVALLALTAEVLMGGVERLVRIPS